jgi:hypothetical protein
MMKRMVAMIILMFAAMPFLVICQVKTDESKVAQQVRQADNEFHKAIRTSDTAALEKILAADFIWTHSTGNIQTKMVVWTISKPGNSNTNRWKLTTSKFTCTENRRRSSAGIRRESIPKKKFLSFVIRSFT